MDLSDATTAGAHLRPRFVARICTKDECARVDAAEDASSLLWSLFAAKEAAYKAVSKLRPGIAFAHRSFEVSKDMHTVCYDDLTLRTRVWRDEDCIHAVALLGERNATAVYAVERVLAGTDLSRAARTLLRKSLAREIGCDASELDVKRPATPGSWTGFGPPVLTRAGTPTDRDISLSHDGRFIAFAAIE